MAVPDVLVIAEHGTDWTASLDRWQSRDVSALIQSPLEPIASFVRRVTRRVARLSLGRYVPATLLLLGPAAWDKAGVRARLDALRALVRKMSWTPGSRVILQYHGPPTRAAVSRLRAIIAKAVDEIGDPHIVARAAPGGVELVNLLAAATP